MNASERYALVTRNLQEVIGAEELKAALAGKKPFSVYWGTMPTGSISIAYFFPMLKIADFLKAGLSVKILLADLHAALAGVSWNLLEKRTEYYKRAITLILKTIGVDIKKLEFVKGSDIQLNKEYFNELLKLSAVTTINEAKHASADVVKWGENPKLSGTIYPLMQALDEEFLHVDAQFGGMDQRKIMVYAREYLPKIKYRARIELMNPIIRGLVGEKMSSSIESSKIDLLDDEQAVESKINRAECAEGDANNGIMALLKYLIFVLKNDKKQTLAVERQKKFGGNASYSSYEQVESDVISKKLHPADLKPAIAREINALLSLLRKDAVLRKLHAEAYG